MTTPSQFAKSYARNMILGFILGKLFSSLYTPKRSGILWNVYRYLDNKFYPNRSSNNSNVTNYTGTDRDNFIDVDRTFK